MDQVRMRDDNPSPGHLVEDQAVPLIQAGSSLDDAKYCTHMTKRASAVIIEPAP